MLPNAMGHGMASDDLFLAFVRYSPLVFVIAGVAVVGWLARQPPAADWRSDVLAALSESEALPAGAIRARPPLDTIEVDLEALVRVLDELCGARLAVRWYEGFEADRRLVYRRLGSTPGGPSLQA